MTPRIKVVALLLAISPLSLQTTLADEGGERDTIASLDRKSVAIEHGGEFNESSAKARENYRAFLELTNGDPLQRAQAMRRLGDLELEIGEAEQLSRNVDSIGGEMQANAVELYRSLLETYPDFERNDVVLYQLARAYELSGRTGEALRVLDDVVRRYPEIAQIDDVQFRRGEILFQQKHYDAAEQAYAAAVAVGETSRYYEQSLYKLGWSRFKLGWYEDSLPPFFELLGRKLAGPVQGRHDVDLAGLSRANRELVEDTLRVLSVSFSYLGGADSIHAFFAAQGHPEYAFIIYQRLGDLYLDTARFQDAAEAYGAFVARDPYHPASPSFQVAVIEAYRQGGFPTLVLEAKKVFVEHYGLDSPFWQEHPRAEQLTTEAYLRENLADLAQYYHAEAQREEDPRDYLAAAGWYRRYLDYFPDDPDSANVSFMLGEALLQGGMAGEAIEAFERTAYTYPPNDQSAEAAYATVLSYREHGGTLTDEQEFAWRQGYLDSGLRFARAFPEHPESFTVLTAIAEDLFQHGQFEHAIDVGQTVVGRVPAVDATLSRTAWTVIAHSQFDLGNFAAAEQAYYALRPFTPADDLVANDEIKERIASSIYKQGEQARDAGELETAVTHFQRLGRAVPDSAFRETAEYDAAAALIAMASWDRASAVLEDFRRMYPDSQYADDVTQKLAVTYLEAGQGAAAAGEFVRIANASGSSEEVRREALWRASDLYKDSGDVGEEQQVLEDIVARYPEPIAESIEARYRLLEIAEQGGDKNRRTRILQDLVYVDATAGAQRSDRTRYLAAKASLELAEPVRRSFMVMKLTQPLAQSMELKRSLMEDVLQVYGDAAAYGVAEVTTAATYRLGEVYRQFSADLLDSERPEGLDALALEQYELLLEEQIFPFEEKAIELFEANAGRTADGIWDEWVQRSFGELATMMPARYAKAERSEDVVTALY